MMQALLMIALLFFADEGFAQVQLEAKSLYEDDARIPGVIIPLKLSGDILTQGGIAFSANVKSANGADCRIMKDPFLPLIYLLKCASPSEVQVFFKIEKSRQLFELQVGPIDINYPSGTQPLDEDRPPNPEVLRGKDLFSQCVNCHKSSDLRQRTSDQIKNAIQGVPDMKDLTNLSAEQIRLIAVYLGTL